MTVKSIEPNVLVTNSPSASRTTATARLGAMPLLALAPIALVVPSGTTRADRAKLALLGAIPAIFLLFAGKVWFPGGADQFLQYAEAIAHGTTLPPILAQREAGYPLLILLGGYSLLHSLIPVFLLQAGFAVLLPLLIYESIRRLSPTAAFYAGLASIVSLSPFLFMKMIHHDQSYIFFSALMLCQLLIFIQTKQVRFLYWFTAAAICASVTRPAGNALFPLFLIVSYIAVRGRGVHYLACLGAFAAFLAGYSWHRDIIFDSTRIRTTPSYVGAQMFYNPYLNTLDYGIRLSPEQVGPNFALALATLRDRLQPSPKQSKFMPLHYVGSADTRRFAAAYMFPYTAEQLIDQILARPNYEYYTLICEANDDRILLRAALEIARAHPAMILRYATRNIFHFIFDPGYSHTRYNFNPFRPVGLVFFPGQGPVAGDLSHLPAQTVRELNFDSLSPRPPIVEELLATMQSAWWDGYSSWAALVAYLMVAAWLVAIAGLAGFDRWWTTRAQLFAANSGDTLALTGALTISIVIASLVFVYNAAVTSVFAEPDFRYREMVDPQVIVVAGLGLASIPFWLKVALGRTLAAKIAERWDAAARFSYACDIWRRLSAVELAGIAGAVVGAGFAAWTLYMVKNTLA